MQMIFMADIVGSRDKEAKKLINDFKAVVNWINEKESQRIISPLTITLGDEFQSVVKTLPDALFIIILMEEQIVKMGLDLKLRYVLYQGKIETEINTSQAYGMLGEGLTLAREALIKQKEGHNRFYFHLKDENRSMALNNIFLVMQSTIDGWDLKRDYQIVKYLLETGDYKKVAEILHRDPSLIWKRRKNLQINEYLAIKNVINYIGTKNYA